MRGMSYTFTQVETAGPIGVLYIIEYFYINNVIEIKHIRLKVIDSDKITNNFLDSSLYSRFIKKYEEEMIINAAEQIEELKRIENESHGAIKK